MTLDWQRLLCDIRLRELMGGPPSVRIKEDGRTQFDRDYDRTIFSTPVRRLQDKTQVFPLEPNDAVRTRLTHSLEVSTLARGVARGAAQWLLSAGHIKSEQQARDIESIAATCGLIHDLGNPPFGHAGEKAISSWFEKKLHQDGSFFGELDCAQGARQPQLRNDFLLFEGNAQTIRIVTRLQLLADEYGLNLTVGTLSAAMKYTAASDELVSKSPHSKTKPGYFTSEHDIIEKIREQSGTETARNPIAYLVEACDDMVYATVDIEDGVKKGIVSWQDVKRALRTHSSPSARPIIRKHIKDAQSYINRANPPLSGKARDEAISQHFRTLVIGTIKVAVLDAFKAFYNEIMQGAEPKNGELIKASSAADLIKACKSVGAACIYSSDETLRLETMGRRIIHDLMDIFWDGASAYPSIPHLQSDDELFRDFTRSPEGKIYNLLSRNYRTAFESAMKRQKLPERYHRFQLVTDYVCGMTDTFACKLHTQLTHG